MCYDGGVQNSDKNIVVQITSGTIVKGILIAILFLVLFQIRDIILIVLTAVVLASAIEPLTKLLIRYKISRLPATILIYLGLAAILLGLTYFILPTLLNDFSGFLGNLPKYLNYAQAWIPFEQQGILEQSATLRQISETSFSLSQIVNDLSSAFSNLSEGFVRTVSLIFGGVFSFALIVVLSFYLAVQEDGVGDFLRLVSPKKHEAYIISLWKRSQHKIGLWMQGQLLLGVTVGVMVYVTMLVLGIKHALLLAILAAFFELIPVFGPILSAIPGVLTGLADRGPVFAVLIGLIYVIIQQFENHLFYPLVVKKIIGISPIVVILALVVGGKLAGFLGIILAIPLSTILMEYVHDIQKDKLNDASVLYHEKR